MALTATATPQVRADIINQLGFVDHAGWSVTPTART